MRTRSLAVTATQNRKAAYNRAAPRRPVNLSLNTDLLAEVRKLTPNLSATVETLLEDYLQKESAQRQSEQNKLNEVIDAMNDYHSRHGFLSEQFQDF
jgi:antitoxin CcdA